MKCPECGLEMMIYSATVNADGGSDTAYVCRNPQCARYDRRLRKRRTLRRRTLRPKREAALRGRGGWFRTPPGARQIFLLSYYRTPCRKAGHPPQPRSCTDDISPAGRREKPEYGERRA